MKVNGYVAIFVNISYPSSYTTADRGSGGLTQNRFLDGTYENCDSRLNLWQLIINKNLIG